MPSLADLDPETRAQVHRAAIAEIDLFQAGDDPRMIEDLAAAGREGCGEGDVGAWVSEAQEQMAEDLRRRQQELAAACGALGSLVRLMVRG
ncbi:hypothetical protein [Caulobacter sp. NIBR1757]|uniref:hypothetical protein n=1 Tax=Caulobacter sp. NIBR1757 TaxID=3016000 RepID=UPI0022F0417A|nr:hypothetical protein [Caulobacter sp. NIBR1757]WGM39937.1 hypothetical protein AMEJIAPC_02877 [Caulobacter sp. NIBR1757]